MVDYLQERQNSKLLPVDSPSVGVNARLTRSAYFVQLVNVSARTVTRLILIRIRYFAKREARHKMHVIYARAKLRFRHIAFLISPLIHYTAFQTVKNHSLLRNGEEGSSVNP
jgi:hypothetical protein